MQIGIRSNIVAFVIRQVDVGGLNPQLAMMLLVLSLLSSGLIGFTGGCLYLYARRHLPRLRRSAFGVSVMAVLALPVLLSLLLLALHRHLGPHCCASGSL